MDMISVKQVDADGELDEHRFHLILWTQPVSIVIPSSDYFAALEASPDLRLDDDRLLTALIGGEKLDRLIELHSAGSLRFPKAATLRWLDGDWLVQPPPNS